AKKKLSAAARVPLQQVLQADEDNSADDKEKRWKKPPREETWSEFFASGLKPTLAISLLLIICLLTPVGDVLSMLLKATGPVLTVVLAVVVLVGVVGVLTFFTRGGQKKPQWFGIFGVLIVIFIIAIIIGILGFSGYKIQPLQKDADMNELPNQQPAAQQNQPAVETPKYKKLPGTPGSADENQ